MESYLAENLEVLKAERPALYQRIIAGSGTKREIEPIYNGKANLKIIFEGDSRFIHDPANPDQEMARLIDKLNPAASGLVIVAGVGAGYALAELERRFGAGQVNALVIEEDPAVFKVALSNFRFTELLKSSRMDFWVGHTKEELVFKAGQLFSSPKVLLKARQLKLIILPSIAAIANDYYAHAFKAVRHAMGMADHRLHPSTLERDFKLTSNAVLNLADMIQLSETSRVENLFFQKPGIAVGAGPSLAKQLPLLREVAPFVVMVAASSALNPLLEAGIEPSVITAVDYLRFVSTSAERLQQYRRMSLLSTPVIPPDERRLFCGPKGYVSTGSRFLDDFKLPLLEFTAGTSSGNMAFSVCRFLGCRPIILIGLDFGRKETEKYHAPGTLHSSYAGAVETWENYLKIKVPGYYGGEVISNPLFDSDRRLLSIQIKKCGVEVINSTEGGARIDGAVQRPFSETVACIRKEELPAYQMLAAALKPAEASVISERSSFCRKILEQDRTWCRSLLRDLESILLQLRGWQDGQSDGEKLISSAQSIKNHIESSVHGNSVLTYITQFAEKYTARFDAAFEGLLKEKPELRIKITIAAYSELFAFWTKWLERFVTVFDAADADLAQSQSKFG